MSAETIAMAMDNGTTRWADNITLMERSAIQDTHYESENSKEETNSGNMM